MGNCKSSRHVTSICIVASPFVLAKGIQATVCLYTHNIGYCILFSQEQQGEVSVTANLGDSPCKIELSSLVPPNGLVSV